MTKINRKTGDNNPMLLFEDAFLQVKNEIEKALTGSPLIIREYLSHLTLSQGKYIRAFSVLTASLNADRMVADDAVKAAAAIEVLHLASLVHDDIIDDSELRRGSITLQKKYGKKTAVICGDYLLSLALRMLSGINEKEDYKSLRFPDYVGRLCLGELNQHINNHNLDLSLYTYLKIISGKTAALFEAAFFAGAVTGKKTEKEVESYKKIGHCIGMIFQLSDDCLDFDTTVLEAQKPVQSDYDNGVITLPLIHALHNDVSFKSHAQKGNLTRKEVDEAVRKSDGLGFTRIVINRYYSKAMKAIKMLSIENNAVAEVIALLDKAARFDQKKKA